MGATSAGALDFIRFKRRVAAVFTIRELLTYSSLVRRRFFERLKTLPWDEVTKNREASHYSMRNIMVHIIDNEDWIVNWVSRGRGTEYKKPRPAEDCDLASLERHLEEVEGRTKDFLERGNEEWLRRRVTFVVSSGSFDLSAEECILQCFTEQLYHLGELIALLWQDDIEPPRMQWFWNNPRVANEQSAH